MDNTNQDNQIVAMPIPPGLPQSIIIRLLEICNVRFDLRKDEIHDIKYPVLCGTLEDLKIAKEYLEASQRFNQMIETVNHLLQEAIEGQKSHGHGCSGCSGCGV